MSAAQSPRKTARVQGKPPDGAERAGNRKRPLTRNLKRPPRRNVKRSSSGSSRRAGSETVTSDGALTLAALPGIDAVGDSARSPARARAWRAPVGPRYPPARTDESSLPARGNRRESSAAPPPAPPSREPHPHNVPALPAAEHPASRPEHKHADRTPTWSPAAAPPTPAHPWPNPPQASSAQAPPPPAAAHHSDASRRPREPTRPGSRDAQNEQSVPAHRHPSPPSSADCHYATPSHRARHSHQQGAGGRSGRRLWSGES